jgi:hypothetical protein
MLNRYVEPCIERRVKLGITNAKRFYITEALISRTLPTRQTMRENGT